MADVTIAGQSPLQPTQLRYAPAGGWAWPFDCGGVDIGLIPGTPAGEQEGAPCVDFLVQDVDQAYRTLRERGVRFLKEPHDTPWGGRIALFADPDGNVLQLVQIDWPRYFAACAPR